ncbi:MAG: histidine kinase [Firmicutes bacterium]|nr:histidine kinase [Bacillota bacterium]
MIELLDNFSQLLITLLATIGAGILFYKRRVQAYLLLTCFFGTFMLGTLYWTLHFYLFNYTPQVFYVSELAWIASSMFLLTLEYTLSTPDEKKFRHPAVWLVPIFCIPQLILYLLHGDILFNLLICGLTMAVAWHSTRGLIYARRQSGEQRAMQYFHIVVLLIIILEYCLWTSSCFWISDTYTNPYFWFDFLLSVSLFALLPATKKAVGA